MDKFDKLVDKDVGEDGINKLGIAVGKRDENAHTSPPDITFRELEKAFYFAKKVVEAVKLTLEPQT